MRKSLSRLFRSFWYLITFRVDKAAEAIQKNPAAVSASYDRIIEDKRKAIGQYKDSVASLISQEEGKRERLRVLTAEIQNLQKLRDGAVAKAKKLQSTPRNPDAQLSLETELYNCKRSFRDFSAALNGKNAKADELESDIEQLAATIASHKSNLQQMIRELDELKTEKHDAVADLLAAAEEAKAAEAIIGVSDDRSAEELRELRDIRNKAAAQARIGRDLAGLSTKQQEAEFRQYAESTDADNEFDQLIGVNTSIERINQLADVISQTTRIPEGN